MNFLKITFVPSLRIETIELNIIKLKSYKIVIKAYQCCAPGIKQKAPIACIVSTFGMVESGWYWRQKRQLSKGS
jgi:hypothetical protein